MACNNCGPCGNQMIQAGPLLPVAIMCDTTGGGGGGGADIEPVCLTDSSGTQFFGVMQFDTTGTFIGLEFYIVGIDGSLIPYVPTSAPAPCDSSIESVSDCYIAVNDGLNYSIGDQITVTRWYSEDTNPPTLLSTLFYNQTTLTPLLNVPPADLTPCSNGDVELIEVLCDVDPATREVLGKVWHELHYDSQGNQTDFILVGVHLDAPLVVERPYIVVGELANCELIHKDFILCDEDGNSFIRHYIYGNGTQYTIYDTELDGETAYIPVGEVSVCTVTTVVPLVMCDNGVNFVRHYQYNNGTVIGHFDTEPDSETPYVVADEELVTAGECVTNVIVDEGCLIETNDLTEFFLPFPTFDNAWEYSEDSGNTWVSPAPDATPQPMCRANMNTQWRFGQNAGLDFMQNPAVPVPSLLNREEGVSSIADVAGNLIFYTDGTRVWDANDVDFTGVPLLLGNSSSTQSALILPFPGTDPNIYYLITTDQSAAGNGLVSYNIVDMSIPAVTIKNVIMQGIGGGPIVTANASEKLVGVSKANGFEAWVITSEKNTGTLYVWDVTDTGIALNGTYTFADAFPIGFSGQMALSPDGTRLSLVNVNDGTAHVYDFDPVTGTISNKQVITGLPLAYGVAFSPNSDVLYVACGGSANVYQFDLTTLTYPATAASASTTFTSQTTGYRALQIAPDGRIYIAQAIASHAPFNGLDWIANPDVVGVGANYVQNLNFFPTGASRSGLNNQFSCPVPLADDPDGRQRYRTEFAIPECYSGTYSVTVSGILDTGTGTGEIYYDGVFVADVIPPDGPFTLSFPATPGPHIFEYRRGPNAVNSSASLIVTVDYSNVIVPPISIIEAVTIVRIFNSNGDLVETRYLNANGDEVVPLEGQEIRSGVCDTCPSVTDEAIYYVSDEILCDDNGTFLRKYVQQVENGTGSIVSVDDFTIDGLAYITVGTVRLCGETDDCFCREPRTEVLCDLGETFAEQALLDGTMFASGTGLDVDWTVTGGTPEFGTGWRFLNNAGLTVNTTKETTARWSARISGALPETVVLTMPVGTIATSIHATHSWNPLTRELTSPVSSAINISTFASLTPTDVYVFGESGTALSGHIGLMFVTPVTPDIQFLRTWCMDCDGNTTVIDTTLDGETPYVTVGDVGLCTPDGQPNSIKLLTLCDEVTTFLRRQIFNNEGVLVGTIDTELDGLTPYSVVGTVRVCNGSQTDYEQQVLCDTVDELVTPFIRNFTHLNGTTNSWDTTLDGITPYTALGTVGTCLSDGFDTEVAILCDDNGSFIRHFIYTTSGVPATVIDTTLDGVTPYVTVGTVQDCGCRNVETETLCDSVGDASDATTVVTNTDSTPWFGTNGVPVGGDVQGTNGQVIWSGSILTVPGTTSPPDTVHTMFAGRVNVSGICGNEGTANIQASLRVRNDGVGTSVGPSGRLRLMDGPATQVAVSSILNNVPVNGQVTLTIPVTGISLAKLIAGDYTFVLDLETFSTDSRQWTVDLFDYSVSDYVVTGGAEGCGPRFIRTSIRDCRTGSLLETIDTELDGITPYSPFGAVVACSGQPGDAVPTVLCDVSIDSDGSPIVTSFLRRIVLNGDGDVSSVIDTELDGRKIYRVLGDVVDCSVAPNSCCCQTHLLCDHGAILQTPSVSDFEGIPFPIATGPTNGVLAGNGVAWSVDQGVMGGSSTYLIDTGTTQTWTFDQIVQVRVGIRNLNVGNECVILPEGIQVESIHPNHTWNPVLRRICNNNAAATDTSYFFSSPTTEFELFSTASGGGARGINYLGLVIPVYLQGNQPFLRKICADGAVVTDTLVDGITPYSVVGEITTCQDAVTNTVPLCDSETSFLRHYTYEGGDLTDVYDTAMDGVTPYATVGVVGVCGETDSSVEILYPRQKDLTSGGAWNSLDVTVGRTLVGLSYTVLLGSATTSANVGATSIANLPTGYSASWEAEDSNSLQSGISIASGTGRVIVVWTEKG